MIKALVKKHWVCFVLLAFIGWSMVLDNMADGYPDVVSFRKAYSPDVKLIKGYFVGRDYEKYMIDTMHGYGLQKKTEDGWIWVEGSGENDALFSGFFEDDSIILKGQPLYFDMTGYGGELEPGEYRLRQNAFKLWEKTVLTDNIDDIPHFCLEFTVE